MRIGTTNILGLDSGFAIRLSKAELAALRRASAILSNMDAAVEAALDSDFRYGGGEPGSYDASELMDASAFLREVLGCIRDTTWEIAAVPP